MEEIKEKMNPIRQIRFEINPDCIFIRKKPKERKVVIEYGTKEFGQFQLVLTPFQAEKILSELVELITQNFENRYNFSKKKRAENLYALFNELARDLKLRV